MTIDNLTKEVFESRRRVLRENQIKYENKRNTSYGAAMIAGTTTVMGVVSLTYNLVYEGENLMNGALGL